MKIKHKGLAAVSVLSLAVAVLMGSCKKNDLEKPTIEIVNPHSDGSCVAPGSKLRVKMILTDNEELGSVKLNFKWDGDGNTQVGHPQSRSMLGTRSEGTEKLSYSWWKDGLGGRSLTLEHGIMIPANAKRGSYRLEVSCADMSGNKTKAFREVHVAADRE